MCFCSKNTMNHRKLSIREIQSKYKIISLISDSTNYLNSKFLVKNVQTGFLRLIKKINLDQLEHFDDILADLLYTKQLQHPNIMCYLESKVIDCYLYLTTPFFEYGSCDDLIRNHFNSGFPENVIAIVTRGVLEALQYIHSKNFIHRAICGSNIFISANGLVGLAGIKFGCQMIEDSRRQAKIFSFPHNSTKNLNWLSPEILEQNLNGYNEKSDIYSLGITMCELGNGIVPFSDVPSTFMLLEKSKAIVPELLDSTTIAHQSSVQLNCDEDDMSDGTNYKYEMYSKKKFSSSFHKFKEACVNYDPNRRPSAKELLTYSFVKSVNRMKVDFGRLMYPVMPMSENLQNRNENVTLTAGLDTNDGLISEWN